VRAPGFEPWWVSSHRTILPLDYRPNRESLSVLELGVLARHPIVLVGRIGPSSSLAQVQFKSRHLARDGPCTEGNLGWSWIFVEGFSSGARREAALPSSSLWWQLPIQSRIVESSWSGYNLGACLDLIKGSSSYRGLSRPRVEGLSRVSDCNCKLILIYHHCYCLFGILIYHSYLALSSYTALLIIWIRSDIICELKLLLWDLSLY
jgi:hypothetical protein